MIERQIIIGLIVSTEYLRKVKGIWNNDYIESSVAKQIATWVFSYYKDHEIAPKNNIEGILLQKIREGLNKDVAEEIEEDILPGLSSEYTNKDFNVEYLYTETFKYFRKRRLEILSQSVDSLLSNKVGSVEERIKNAEEFVNQFSPLSDSEDSTIDLSERKHLDRIRQAFAEVGQPIICFPKALGEFWNSQFTRGSFVSFMASEKRGKSFILLELAIKASRQGRKVAFFQAGDMNEGEQLKRIGVYLAKRSNLEKYCGVHYESVRDCIHNQTGECVHKLREFDVPLFDGDDEETIRKKTFEELVDAAKERPEYQPCWNCLEYAKHKWGVPFVKKVEEVRPLDEEGMIKLVKKFFIRNKRNFKLSTHANGTLSVSNIKDILRTWWDSERFAPDIILIDYADLLVPSVKMEFRHQQNQTWKELRSLSQTKIGEILPLVISPTQADADSYDTDRLSLHNFSEDKRKYAHVTAMYGLNQDKNGREKKLGIMRINKIISREEDFNYKDEVTVLQNLKKGRPFLQSYK